MLLSRYLSRNHLVTTPIPLCYHCITLQYFPRIMLPILRSTDSRLASPDSQYPPLFLCSAITRRVKNRTKMRFFLQMRKFCCTFATAIRIIGFADINKKRLLALVLELLKSGKFPSPKARTAINAHWYVFYRADSARCTYQRGRYCLFLGNRFTRTSIVKNKQK